MTGQQLAILRILWQQGEATVAEVQQALSTDRPLAHTTVATLLTRLADRGVVERGRRGRKCVYRPLVSRTDVRQDRVRELVETLFEGNPKALVTQLVRSGELGADDLIRLAQALTPRSSGD